MNEMDRIAGVSAGRTVTGTATGGGTAIATKAGAIGTKIEIEMTTMTATIRVCSAS